MLLIKNAELVLEFMLKENDVTNRILTVELPTHLGFPLVNGEHGLRKRSYLAKLFYAEKLNEFIPVINETVDSTLQSLAKNLPDLPEELPAGFVSSNDGFKTLDCSKIITDMFYIMVDKILFGSKREVRIDGMSLLEAANLVFRHGLIEAISHPLNILSGGLASKYKLIECSRKAMVLNNEIYEVLGKEIDARVDLPQEDLGVNVMDLLIVHNKNAQTEDILSKDEIIRNCLVFYVAGVEASKSLCEFILHNFSRDWKVQ